jgi:uncharacterized phage-associated protein
MNLFAQKHRAVTTANRVAERLINLSHEKQDPITNLKLQKLLYYAQAWHLALYDGEPLFEDAIEAWVHGPVVPSIFRQYKEFRWNPISKTEGSPLSERIEQHLESVWKIYGKFDATMLERRTHSEEPWLEARGGLPLDVPSHNVITPSRMRTYYSSLLP